MASRADTMASRWRLAADADGRQRCAGAQPGRPPGEEVDAGGARRSAPASSAAPGDLGEGGVDRRGADPVVGDERDGEVCGSQAGRGRRLLDDRVGAAAVGPEAVVRRSSTRDPAEEQALA